MVSIKFAVFCILLSSYASAQENEKITSPPITDWGDWGFTDRCPNGTLVHGFQLKTEPYRGALIDDTALNGVRFFCGNPLDPNTRTVTSVQGSWGNWGNVYACGQNGVIIGFQLRVEQQGIVDDETATNNARFLCSNMQEGGYIEGDGLTFGAWRGTVKCSNGSALCGIQAQVQPDRGALLDDTAMNNLGAECCRIPSDYFSK